MYINGAGAISPQPTHTGDFPFAQATYQDLRLTCLEPDYKEFIAPKTLRRMSRVVKMGTGAALIALGKQSPAIPDAIVTGTGFGCMSDTEKFLSAITEHQEKFLNPAPFIHSTHNTISSQIALLLNCTGYNQTYVQGPFSFESALLDGLMLLQEPGFNSVLVGGVDEMTPDLQSITGRFGHWKRKPLANKDLLTTDSKGTLAGEGACFFLLAREKSLNTIAKVKDVSTLFGRKTDQEIDAWVTRFLEENDLTPDDPDLCLYGKNGDNRFDSRYTFLQEGLLNRSASGYFKHLCGEYLTASAFAVWLAASILKHQQIPDFMTPQIQPVSSLQSILILNAFRSDYQSLILLQSS